MRKKLHAAKTKYIEKGKKHIALAKRAVRKPLFTIPFAIAVVFSAVIAIGLSQRGTVTPMLKTNSSNVVLLTYDKKQHTLPTDAKTVGELLDRAHITLNEGDIVEPAKDSEIVGDNFRINVYRAAPVTIVDNGHRTFTYSAATTPRSILRQAGVSVYPEDTLTLAPVVDFLGGDSIGRRVVIDRAVPVYMNVYGTPITLRTHAKTVADLVKEKGIVLAKDDTVQPSLTTPLTPSTQVFLVRNGSQVQTVEQKIAFPVQRIEDKSLSFGASAVRQQGVDGKRMVTYQINLQNGVEVSRSVIQDVVVQEAVPQIIAQGIYYDVAANKQKIMAAAGIGESDYRYVDYIVSKESGWCHTKWQGEYGGCKAFHGTPTSSSTGYGLCQSTPGWKMASAGSDWATNPVTQLKWCTNYASRYGGWAGAYNVWTTKHWW